MNNDIRNRTAIEYAIDGSLTAAGAVRKPGGLRHPDGTFITEAQLDAWLEDGLFVELVEQVKGIINTILDRLSRGGVEDSTQVNQMVHDGVEQWALVSSLIAASPAPEARPFPGVRPSSRRLWADLPKPSIKSQ